MKKLFVSAVALGCAASALAAATLVQQTVRPRSPYSRVIDIDYVLSCDPGELYDMRPVFKSGATVLDVSGYALSGNFNAVSDGAHRLTVDLSKSSLADVKKIDKFSVTLTPTEAALYMIVDCRRTGADNPRVTYLTRSDIESGAYGSYETDMSKFGIVNCSLRNPIVWTACTNEEKYVATHMLFRRIPAGSFIAAGSGATADNVFVTKSFWLSVFEFTQANCDVAGGSTSVTYPLSADKRAPRYNLSTSSTRGSTNATDGVNWPETGYGKVAAYVNNLRTYTGLRFDIPTEAQWELAYRAGTTTSYYLGTGTSSGSNQWANAIGHYKYNGGQERVYNETTGEWEYKWRANASSFSKPGSYAPNAFGLYDMAGNIEEQCLDWQVAVTSPYHLGKDPVGPTFEQATTKKRVSRGGSAWHDGTALTAEQRQGAGQDENSSLFGWRFAVIDEPTLSF